jgi:hypothetical protein
VDSISNPLRESRSGSSSFAGGMSSSSSTTSSSSITSFEDSLDSIEVDSSVRSSITEPLTPMTSEAENWDELRAREKENVSPVMKKKLAHVNGSMGHKKVASGEKRRALGVRGVNAIAVDRRAGQ